MRIDCYVGRVKISEYPEFESFNIYLSIKMINNTKDTIFVPPPYDSLFPEVISNSYFMGQIESDEIYFNKIRRNSYIPPYDSIKILLYHDLYKPKVADSLFIKEMENMTIKYKYEDEPIIPLNYARDVKIHMTNHSKVVVLYDYTGIEGAWEFGNREFEY